MALRRKSPFPLLLTFFGLSLDFISEERMALFTQLHEMCFWGQGGYDFETVYNLPIWLRNFIFNNMKKHYDKENSNNQDQIIKKSIANLKAGATPSPPSNQKLIYKTEASKK